MYKLFIDTHSDKVILILYKDNKILMSKIEESNYHHSQVIMPMLDNLLKENKIKTADLNEIIVVNGPGSFTGVRISVTIAKTLAYTLNIPIKTIDSLLLKVINVESNNNINVIEKEKNGAYLGIFNKDYLKQEEYKYLSNDEYEEFLKNNNVIEDVEIDYNKVLKYMENVESINPHIVNPLYIKRIEVER